MLKVLKFGGSAIERMEKLEMLINKGTVVVVSALPGVTDALYKAFPSRSTRDIGERHLRFLEGLETENKMEIADRIEQKISEANSAETQDEFVSYGERLSALIVSGYLEARGMRTIIFESDTLPINTDENGEILLDECSEAGRKILDAIDAGKIPIITGYFGIDRSRRVKTLGRGGSDYTASAIAYIIDAGTVELWKDVEGFMSADPKIVEGARKIEKLSYEEAAELAHHGAKILHPRAIEPAVRTGIKVFIKCIDSPESEGTVICSETEESGRIRAVSFRKGLRILKFSIPGLAYTRIPGRLLDAIYGSGKIVYAISTSQASLAVLTDGLNREEFDGVRAECINDVALIATVGKGIGAIPGVSGDVFESMKNERINVLMISEGASDSAINFVVNEKECDRAVRALHKDLIKEV
jgi:aspartate kinase